MAGTGGDRVNPRRRAILEAAGRQFADVGYDRTSTASICRAAGVSSGTFFHHFPTKLDVLVGVLDAGRDATAHRLAALEERDAGLTAVLAHAADTEAEAGDPDFPGSCSPSRPSNGTPGWRRPCAPRPTSSTVSWCGSWRSPGVSASCGPTQPVPTSWPDGCGGCSTGPRPTRSPHQPHRGRSSRGCGPCWCDRVRAVPERRRPRSTGPGPSCWSGRRESNSHYQLGKLKFYH